MFASPTSACPTKRCTESTFLKVVTALSARLSGCVCDSFPVVCSPRVRLRGTFVILLIHTKSAEHSSESAPRFLLFVLFVEGFIVTLMFVVPSCLSISLGNRLNTVQFTFIAVQLRVFVHYRTIVQLSNKNVLKRQTYVHLFIFVSSKNYEKLVTMLPYCVI
jgi:hypothetical protein